VWEGHDATLLMEKSGPFPFDILISQGDADQFLKEKQLLPEALQKACEAKGQRLTYKSEEGYDHSYYFISTFVDEHIEFHSKWLL
jgi:S-formylglutathione hydrolase